MAFVIGLLSILNSDFNSKDFLAGLFFREQTSLLSPTCRPESGSFGFSPKNSRNEPLRFLVQVDGEGEGLDRIELQTRVFENRQSPIGMSARQNQKFSLDYNVGREPFEFRILADGAPITMKWGSQLSQWFRMGVARPYVTSYRKAYSYPSYTRLTPTTTTDKRGDLKPGREPLWNFSWKRTKP